MVCSPDTWQQKLTSLSPFPSPDRPRCLWPVQPRARLYCRAQHPPVRQWLPWPRVLQDDHHHRRRSRRHRSGANHGPVGVDPCCHMSVRSRPSRRCPGCPYGGLDMSYALFQVFDSLDTGVSSVTWWYNDEAPAPTTSTSQWVAPTTTSTTSQWVAPTTSTSTTSQWVAPTTSSTYTPPAPSSSSSSSGVSRPCP